LYKETWEDGITGFSTKDNKNNTSSSSSGVGIDDDSSSTLTIGPITQQQQQQLQAIGDNAANNLRIVRKDARDLLEHTKETTGIRNQDDMKALASEAMKIATECIKEFMAGYRKGRDTEIDKMLHEYFQQEEEEENNVPNKDEIMSTTANTASATGRRKKRKPKRGIPRE